MSQTRALWLTVRKHQSKHDLSPLISVSRILRASAKSQLKSRPMHRKLASARVKWLAQTYAHCFSGGRTKHKGRSEGAFDGRKLNFPGRAAATTTNQTRKLRRTGATDGCGERKLRNGILRLFCTLSFPRKNLFCFVANTQHRNPLSCKYAMVNIFKASLDGKRLEIASFITDSACKLRHQRRKLYRRGFISS